MPSGQVFLAPKDFRSDQPAVNGRPLQWLVDLLEDCPAKEKLLLLDGSHAGSGAEQAAEPSSAEMIRALKRQPNRALLLKVTAVASCRKGQRGLDLPDKEHGLFAWCLAEGYGGAADANRDTLVEPTELFAYLQKDMPAAAAKGAQAPELFLPDDRPPRLSEAAKTSIRKLAGYADQLKVNLDEASQEYDVALQAAGDEPEPRLLFGLVLLKKEGSRQGHAALRNREERTARSTLALRGPGLAADGKAGLSGGDSRVDEHDQQDSQACRARPARCRRCRLTHSSGRGNCATMRWGSAIRRGN